MTMMMTMHQALDQPQTRRSHVRKRNKKDPRRQQRINPTKPKKKLHTELSRSKDPDLHPERKDSYVTYAEMQLACFIAANATC